MTDHIQPEPSRGPKHGDFTDAADPLVDELRHRLRVLEQEKRRWKLIGVSALVALALVVGGGGVVGVGMASLYAYRVQRAEMEAMIQRDQAQVEAMRAQEALEQARRQAKQADEQAQKRQAEQDAK